MKRQPIVRGVAIFHRVAIFPRKPCCSGVDWKRCKLCSQFEDCVGNSFIPAEIEDLDTEKTRLIRVINEFEDWESIEQQLWRLSAQGTIVRLVTDVELPKEIIWAASYSEKNIIQINFDMTQRKKGMKWIDKTMSIANRCGVYCVLCFHPIVPGYTMTYQVIEVIDQCKSHGYFHVNLKFCEITGNVIESDGWLNFNGHVIPVKYMEKTSDGWECTQEYKQLFLSKIQLFTKPKKLSVSVCSNENECTGLSK